MSHSSDDCGFFVFDGTSLLSFASAIEPLRLANWLSGRTLYSWFVVSRDGHPVTASNGVAIGVNCSVDACPTPSRLFVCSGMNADKINDNRTLAWLRRLRHGHTQINAIGSGAYVLAKSGILYDHRCTTHWEEKEGLSSLYPMLTVTDALFEIDRGVATCAGGTAAIDLMLYLIADSHGREFANAIAEEVLQQGMRPGSAHQRVRVEQRLGVNDHRLAEAVRLMENHIEEAMPLEQICLRIGISIRHLHRLYSERMGISPHRYYLALRLQRARRLITQSGALVADAAAGAGFVSAAHFTRSYKKHFGKSPSAERRGY